MHERCLMLRPRTQTSSPPAGRAAGTLSTTSCRVPPTPRAESCPLPCPCPSCTSTPEEEMEMILKTARAPPQSRGKPSRGTVNLLHTPASRQRVEGWIPVAVVMNQFAQSGLEAGG